MRSLSTQRGGRRWALQIFGASLALAALPAVAFAKRRRPRKKKKGAAAAPEPAAEETIVAGGDALKDAKLDKRDNAWFLKNRNNAQRIVVILRYTPVEGRPSIHVLSLEPGQEIALGVMQPEGVKKPVIEVVAAQLG